VVIVLVILVVIILVMTMTKIFNKKTGALSALSATLLLAVIMPSMPFAMADDTVCVGFITGIHDNVVVPSGAACLISSASISGNVKAESGALSLIISGGSVHGNVQADGVLGDVIIVSATIGGDVQIKNTAATGFDQVAVVSNGIGGNVQIEDNSAFRVRADNNSMVAGDLQFNGNTSTGSFPNIVGSNTVGGNLQCSDNTPVATIAPFGLNTVAGDAEGECATLV